MKTFKEVFSELTGIDREYSVFIEGEKIPYKFIGKEGVFERLEISKAERLLANHIKAESLNQREFETYLDEIPFVEFKAYGIYDSLISNMNFAHGEARHAEVIPELSAVVIESAYRLLLRDILKDSRALKLMELSKRIGLCNEYLKLVAEASTAYKTSSTPLKIIVSKFSTSIPIPNKLGNMYINIEGRSIAKEPNIQYKIPKDLLKNKPTNVLNVLRTFPNYMKIYTEKAGEDNYTCLFRHQDLLKRIFQSTENLITKLVSRDNRGELYRSLDHLAILCILCCINIDTVKELKDEEVYLTMFQSEKILRCTCLSNDKTSEELFKKKLEEKYYYTNDVITVKNIFIKSVDAFAKLEALLRGEDLQSNELSVILINIGVIKWRE